ncbi:hypothetical protein N8T08_008376 [Aspergillus melleus]|uniref:Uncharacterized protein n=1 Tax=Aspergillus melleus TaxID=138277 RepID=A0ACC3AVQ9_9EURO|nr:hypothetical protein N8T08_008376 [Aspergillus melleus]
MDFEFHPGVNGSAPWVEFYPYNPSKTPAYAFMAIFGISTVVHLVLMFPYRAAYFIPLLLGGVCETFSYYGRAWSHNNRTLISSWALQQMLIMPAPPLVAATIYMVLGRIIRACNAEHHSSIRTKRLTLIFVLNDVLCFLTQVFGAGVQVTGDQHIMAIGVKVVLVGLIFALVVFAVFIWVAFKFHQRLKRDPTPVAYQNGGLNWEQYMWAIYVSCVALMIRNLIRTIEFGASDSDLGKKEVYIYIFDAAMMFISIAVLVIWHPGLLIKRLRAMNKANEMYGPLAGETQSADVPLTGYRAQQRD